MDKRQEIKKKKLLNSMRVQIIARFLENLIREYTKENREFPSLEIMPKTLGTWTSWIYDAEKLLKQIDEIEAREET